MLLKKKKTRRLQVTGELGFPASPLLGSGCSVQERPEETGFAHIKAALLRHKSGKKKVWIKFSLFGLVW